MPDEINMGANARGNAKQQSNSCLGYSDFTNVAFAVSNLERILHLEVGAPAANHIAPVMRHSVLRGQHIQIDLRDSPSTTQSIVFQEKSMFNGQHPPAMVDYAWWSLVSSSSRLRLTARSCLMFHKLTTNPTTDPAMESQYAFL